MFFVALFAHMIFSWGFQASWPYVACSDIGNPLGIAWTKMLGILELSSVFQEVRKEINSVYVT